MANTKDKISLLLIDDHSLFRESLSRLLQAEDDIEVVGNYASVEPALERLNQSPVNVVLLDFDLGEQNGISFLRQSTATDPQIRVLIVTAGLSRAETLQILDAGASGIFLKHRSPSDLLCAIRKVARGESALDTSSLRDLTEQPATSAREDVATHSLTLTDREDIALRAVFEGLSNKEIGAKIGISESYVKALLQRLFSKTGVRSRSQLVRVALEYQASNRIRL